MFHLIMPRCLKSEWSAISFNHQSNHPCVMTFSPNDDSIIVIDEGAIYTKYSYQGHDSTFPIKTQAAFGVYLEY